MARPRDRGARWRESHNDRDLADQVRHQPVRPTDGADSAMTGTCVRCHHERELGLYRKAGARDRWWCRPCGYAAEALGWTHAPQWIEHAAGHANGLARVLSGVR